MNNWDGENRWLLSTFEQFHYLNVDCERQKGVKNDSKNFDLSKEKDKGTFTEKKPIENLSDFKVHALLKSPRTKLLWNSIQTHPECPVLSTRLGQPHMERGGSSTKGEQTGVMLKANLGSH